MNSTELLKRFRLEVHDTAVPQLWTDSEIYEFMDDSQKMFCRLTWGIADSTSAVARVKCPSGDEFVKYSPLINKIKLARRLSDYREISVVNIEDIESGGVTSTSSESMWDSGAVKLDATTGPVQYIVTGMEANKFRMVPIPSADETLLLTVYRQPLLGIDGKDKDFEIDEKHHIHLMKWMKHRAYSKQDSETYDKTKMSEFEQQFYSYCSLAKEERERREHKPRLMAYGGIPM